MKFDQTVDVKGLACPMPIVKAKKALDTMASGEVLEVQVTDKGAISDFTAWCSSLEHTLLQQLEEENILYFYIKKA
ncbi:MAG: sulfurtransferase TusA family protein [Kurthia sp.]|nr:sulfurtransferase TusA family protein [Candidatus Kurthia equi]